VRAKGFSFVGHRAICRIHVRWLDGYAHAPIHVHYRTFHRFPVQPVRCLSGSRAFYWSLSFGDFDFTCGRWDLSGSHTAVRISEQLHRVFRLWDITEKIVSGTIDNGSNYVAALVCHLFGRLQRFTRLLCGCAGAECECLGAHSLCSTYSSALYQRCVH
jgi:hypothetical protein